MHESETSESITKGSPEDKNTESDGKGKVNM